MKIMLRDKNAVATIAVKNLKTAKEFYEGKLELKPMRSQEQQVLQYSSGNSVLLVYESSFAGTNKATAATFAVGDDIETIVTALKAKGVAFEHYDLPATTLRGDIHVSGKRRVAWFKDPDGNILSLVNG